MTINKNFNTLLNSECNKWIIQATATCPGRTSEKWVSWSKLKSRCVTSTWLRSYPFFSHLNFSKVWLKKSDREEMTRQINWMIFCLLHLLLCYNKQSNWIHKLKPVKMRKRATAKECYLDPRRTHTSSYSSGTVSVSIVSFQWSGDY